MYSIPRDYHGCVGDSRSENPSTLLIIRLGIVKKWVDALKEEAFSSGTFKYFMQAFKSMLTTSISAEALRALALYITYAVHKPKQKQPQPLRNARSLKQTSADISRRATIIAVSPSPTRYQDSGIELSRLQVALEVLAMYTDLLCEKDDITNIKKFARIVTNKVKVIGSYL